MSDKKRATTDQPDNMGAEKRVRSDSNISHSSWIHKLTSSPEGEDSSQGIWSWLGYAGPKPNDESNDKVDGQQKPNDSVIISNDEEPQQETTIRPNRLTQNVVLPTFESQYHVVEDSARQENTTLFAKAINAINSIFTQKPTTKQISSDWQDINLLNMIDLMKNDPENVAGKKIVIIGVHGWFPMKVILI